VEDKTFTVPTCGFWCWGHEGGSQVQITEVLLPTTLNDKLRRLRLWAHTLHGLVCWQQLVLLETPVTVAGNLILHVLTVLQNLQESTLLMTNY